MMPGESNVSTHVGSKVDVGQEHIVVEVLARWNISEPQYSRSGVKMHTLAVVVVITDEGVIIPATKMGVGSERERRQAMVTHYVSGCFQ